MKTAFLFPGQGAQVVGMGKDIAEAVPQAADVFAKANEILGFDLSTLCFEGPDEKLNTTAISQPAIFVTSVALLEALKTKSDLTPDITAGLSLGEYTALYAAGAMNFEDALRLVAKRGQAMQAAAEASEGGMVSIISMDPDQVKALCDQASQGEPLQPANFNCPGQIVISGAKTACDRAEALAVEMGAAKAVRLQVAGAFHTDLMAPAADALGEALKKCELHDPSPVRVLANTTADYYPDTDAIRPSLVKQLTSAILWQGSMEKLLAEGVETFYEIGPGRVLTGLMRRIHRKTRVKNISSLKSLEDL
ncbi:MAG: ACP S-malonyltransferase [Phycisphaeraceae bacterium]|nr:ACP S-malonyltransferase [Phycisphaeraceae bacterium]